MIYIDPSENRSSSKLKNVLTLEWKELVGLEERTGADMLIGASGLPHPNSDFILYKHIENGAILVQNKFDLDLIASIIDGRYKASQAKMVATGASATQIVCLFIAGVVMESHQDGSLIIGGQSVKQFIPQSTNLGWQNYQEQIFKWYKRGGIFEHLQTEAKLDEWILAAEATMKIAPNVDVWPIQQKLFLVDDWRNTLASLPGVGSKKAQTIFEEYDNWTSFYDALLNDSLAELSGIGPGIIKNIKTYLGE